MAEEGRGCKDTSSQMSPGAATPQVEDQWAELQVDAQLPEAGLCSRYHLYPPSSSPGLSRLHASPSGQRQPQAPELLVPPASAAVPTVVIHPPEEDLEAPQGQEQKSEENVGVAAGNCPKPSMCGAFCLWATRTWNASQHIALSALCR